VELMIAALSSITREGYLYRVDMRLRPHGKNGPLVTSSEGFLDY
jgi:glutamate-ammonia-ligase adenylyltransferase